MTLYNPFFKFLNPRNNGLIAFKGGGGGATSEEVGTIVTDAVDPLVEAGTTIANNVSAVSDGIGSASPTGTVTSSEESFVTPIVESTDAEGTVTSTGGETVNYGGNEVAVTDTVKGDTETIIGNQSNTDDLINQRFDTFQPATVVNQTVDTSNLAKSAAMDAGFATSKKNQDAIRLDLAGIGQDTGQIGGIKTDVGTIKGDTAKIGGIATDLGTVKTGVENASTALGGLKTDVAGVQTGVDTANTNISLLGKDVSEGFSGQQTQVENMQKAVLTGQASMSDVLNAMKEEAATYYGDLSTGQIAIQDSVGGVQTGLDTLRTDQQKANTLANQQRAELAKSVTGGFDQVTSGQRDIQDQATRIADTGFANQGDIQRNQNTIIGETGTFANTAKALSNNQQINSDSASFEKLDFVDRLNTIKSILLNSGRTLDESIRSEYSTLANAFDDQGKLITESVDTNRNPVRRGINQQGNLITNTYNPSSGQLVDQKNTDINQLMAALDTMGYRTLGSQAGDLSSQGMGLMSSNQNQPFIQQNL